ncbi:MULTISPECIES: cupin domain-containing protein [Ensifer]|jgi:mannose-6-phosphate isomerase-like protein (cupin superfamily)|uniref:Cupin domain-containing protein n=1 Tax=Ensifer canadensis TaxID=555315 RepID=A0AAW4FN70_9HYPH|nr:MULTISPECIES: cupin domain-containing protein [Ensifer]KQU73957.1 cupin [Ensifer sp. Root31]KQW58411.1 cupin [Ensifer sp. Root1252]KQW62370.1 cupin [Ensifer sp. Root127]KQY78386.1 cupin [Ensifer sp. Root142]KRC67247.1 cupin [Ensifer sp. Root231]
MTGIHLIEREQWAEKPDVWQGEFQGGSYGADVSVMFYTTDKVGGGPKLHRHPYPETFIIRTGRALFTVGDRKIEAEAGQIVVAPANVPHKFENLGPGRLETTDLHVTGAFATEWLE